MRRTAHNNLLCMAADEKIIHCEIQMLNFSAESLSVFDLKSVSPTRQGRFYTRIKYIYIKKNCEEVAS